MEKYYEGMIYEIKEGYDISDDSPLSELIVTFQYLLEETRKQKEIIDKVNNYLDNYDVFKAFNFPLMKRWEEEQVKSSIDYEFKTSLIKDLKEILEDKEV